MTRYRRSGLEGARCSLYKTQRTTGDFQALSRGRLPRRLARRAVTRRLLRGLFR